MSKTRESHNRRDFLKTSAIASLGASAALNQDNTIAQGKLKRPFVTGRKDKKLVGCYCNVREILEQPAYMDALQEQLGVNVVICRSPIKMPKWLKDMNPFSSDVWMGMSPAKDDDDSPLV